MQKMSAKLRRFAPRTISTSARKIQCCRRRRTTVMEMTIIDEFMSNDLGVKQPCRQKRWLIRTPAVYAVSSF